MFLRPFPIFGALLLLLAAAVPPARADQVVFQASTGPERCTFSARYDPLREQIPEQIGECVENEHLDADGVLRQETTQGQLVYGADGPWPAFHAGPTVWLAGPCGIQARPNGRTLPWERGGGCEIMGSPSLGFQPSGAFACQLAGSLAVLPGLAPGDADPLVTFPSVEPAAYLGLYVMDCTLVDSLVLRWTTFGPGGFEWDTRTASLAAGGFAINGWEYSLNVADAAGLWPGLWRTEVAARDQPLGTFWYRIEPSPAPAPSPTATPGG